MMRCWWKTILAATSLGISPWCAGQTTGSSMHSPAFYQHLKAQKLHGECLTWLTNQEQRESNDSCTGGIDINQEKAQAYLGLGSLDSAFHYARMSTPGDDSTWRTLTLDLAFALRDTAWIRTQLETRHDIPDDYRPAYNLLANRPHPTGSLADHELRLVHDRRVNFRQKRADLAFLCSLVPGGGKYYLGYRYQAITSLVVCALLAGAAVESSRLGTSSFPFIFSSTAFSVFYIGNIWGTMALTKKRVIDFNNQVNEDISHYYRARLRLR